MMSFKISDFYIQNNCLRILFTLVLLIISFFLLIPKPVCNKKKNSDVYSDLSEEIPLNDISPKFNYDL